MSDQPSRQGQPALDQLKKQATIQADPLLSFPGEVIRTLEALRTNAERMHAQHVQMLDTLRAQCQQRQDELIARVRLVPADALRKLHEKDLDAATSQMANDIVKP